MFYDVKCNGVIANNVKKKLQLFFVKKKEKNIRKEAKQIHIHKVFF